MPHHTPLITTLVGAFGLAFVLGALANRLRLSPLVGYLLAGIIAGPFTPGFVADQPLAAELAEIGVILLMFGVGLHFSLDELLAVKAIAIPGAVAQIAVATLLGLGLALGLDWSFGAGLVFGLALSVASTVVLLRALEQRRLIETERGRIAVGWLIVEDLAMVLALVLLPALAGLLDEGGGHAAPGTGELALTLAVTLGKVAAFVALMLLVGRRLIPWSLARIAASGSRELFTLAVLAIALGVAYGAAQLFGVSFALGAFFAGMILGESELSHEAAADSLPLRDAFAVLFFVSVGMLFDPMILLREPLTVLAVVLIIVVGKSAAAWLIVRAFGHPAGTALTISASLAQIGEFSFILATLGVSLDLLPTHGRDLILAGAILSILVNPLLFTALDRVQSRLDRFEQVQAERKVPLEQRTPAPDIASLEGHAIIVGYGRVGGAIGELLARAGQAFVVVDARRELAEQAHGLGVVYGNAAAPESLAAAGVARARRLFVAIPRTHEAGAVIEHARAANPGLEIIAGAHSPAEAERLVARGASRIVIGEREIARGMVEQPFDQPAPAPHPAPPATAA